MCGIAGVAYADLDRRPDPDLLARMAAALQHRGPDEAGAIAEPGVGLCMQRLAVIDVMGGQQPVFNEDHSIAVVFNGEIYNYSDLRDHLIGRGHRFHSNSDTETIVHLYEEQGLDFAKHLHGMFAVAIWDFRHQQLILSRDRLGVKPLYYCFGTDQLRFGSEIKAILQDPTAPRCLDPQGIHQLLTLGHILPPTTCFRGIHELPPAHTMVYRAGEAKIQQYWDLQFSPDPPQLDEQQTEKELLSQIKLAVARRLVSEVPLGAFLSGGIDSGIVVALMSQFLGQPVKTFSIGFDDPSFSELPYARKVAEQYGTDHHELIVTPNVSEIVETLIAHHDAPFYDTSAIPTYYLSQFAKEHVTVALSGDGGDEMFAGYNIYVANKAAGLYRHIPRFLNNIICEPLTHIVPESSKYINKGRVLREFMQGVYLEPLARYTRWATKIKRETRERLYYADELRDQLSRPDEALLAPYFSAQENASELSRLLYVGTKTELPADMLVKVDRMSMAHSLEVRSPLLDHTLFEFAATLPDEAKLKGWTTKHMLRRLGAKLLPDEVIKRPKRGFSVPLDRWLREDLRPFVQEILFDPQTENRGLFDNVFVRELANQHFTSQTSRGRELWTLLTIELWQRNYIDRFAHEVTEPARLHMVSREPAVRGRQP